MSTRTELADAIAIQLANCCDDGSVQRLLDHWLSKVPAEVFSDTGKWKYSVTLDYRNAPAGYLAPHENAVRALRQGTEGGTSEVRFAELHDGWFMFVPEPPEGFPVMVFGGRA